MFVILNKLHITKIYAYILNLVDNKKKTWKIKS